ncbi:MAG: endonuclease/exonuclease/phosphatase family protein, partial [Polyangiaceae bacterium]
MLRLATYNVLNLFDPRNPGERKILDAKIAFLADRIVESQADVVGLQEIASEKLLFELISALEKHAKYTHHIWGTVDHRGIGNAAISRLPFLSSRVLTSPALDFPRFIASDPHPYGTRLPLRRGIVHVEVDGGALGPVDVLVLHFKSARGVPLRTNTGEPIMPESSRDFGEAAMRALIWRAAEALFVRGAADALFAAGKKNVAVMGDFNDSFESTPVRMVRGGGTAMLHGIVDGIDPARRFTVLHNGDKKMIDHILLSTALRDRSRKTRILNEQLHDHDAGVSDEPRADSDHALV